MFELYEERCEKFKREEEESFEYVKTTNVDEALKTDWIDLQSEGVIQHYPPQLIIGKQVAEDKVFLVQD